MVNNYDLAIQQDVAVYLQINFMICYVLKPLPRHFKVKKKKRQ